MMNLNEFSFFIINQSKHNILVSQSLLYLKYQKIKLSSFLCCLFQIIFNYGYLSL